jgi:hypothetical protein
MYTLLTLNSAFLPRFPGAPTLPDHEMRANILCDLLISSAADIVVIQELFVPSIREILVRRLSDVFNIPAGIPVDLLTEVTEESPATMRESLERTISRAKFTVNEARSVASRERSLELASIDADVPFIKSGLFFAYRKGRGILCSDSPAFQSWEDRGPESWTADMGWFYIDLGLTRAQAPSRLRLIGLHMNPYERHARVRRRQLRQLRNALSQMDEGELRPHPKIICGDFNIVGESGEYSETIGGGFLGLNADQYRLKRSDPGYTWDTKNPLTRYAMGGAGNNERLDYVLFPEHPRQRHLLRTSEIRVEEFSTSAYREGFVSDHFGIICEFDSVLR